MAIGLVLSCDFANVRRAFHDSQQHVAAQNKLISQFVVLFRRIYGTVKFINPKQSQPYVVVTKGGSWAVDLLMSIGYDCGQQLCFQPMYNVAIPYRTQWVLSHLCAIGSSVTFCDSLISAASPRAERGYGVSGRDSKWAR